MVGCIGVRIYLISTHTPDNTVMTTPVVAAVCATNDISHAVIEDGKAERVWRNDTDVVCENGSHWVELTDMGWVVPSHWVTVVRRWYVYEFGISGFDDFYTYATTYCNHRVVHETTGDTPLRIIHMLMHALVPLAVIYMIASSRVVVYEDAEMDDDQNMTTL